jgi:hypothetical protein
MRTFSYGVLILHFLGLAMGLSVSIANGVMLAIIAKAAPAERAVLARFPPAMSQVGRLGLGLLWLTGLIMLYTRWNGFSGMPWLFHVKLTAVLVLTGLVVYISQLEAQVRRGDALAVARIQSAGKVAATCALIAVIFAVLTFD